MFIGMVVALKNKIVSTINVVEIEID
jgi:hypothetical protein